MRFLTVAIVLVILPTSILTFLAYISLANREVLLRHKLELQARDVVQEVRRRTSGWLDDDLAAVRTSVGEWLAQGAAFEEMSARAKRLRAGRHAVRQVYVFMNPWGFLYPDSSGINKHVEPEDGMSPNGDRLLALLRERAGGARAGRAVVFSGGGAAYVFEWADGHEGKILTGYEVALPALMKRFERMASELTASGVRLSIGFAEGGVLEAGGGGDVLVTDSFSRNRGDGGSRKTHELSLGLGAEGRSAGDQVLVRERLSEPLDGIEVIALAEPLGGGRTGWPGTSRLYGWGSLLLGAGVLVGVLGIAIGAVRAVREARFRGDYLMGISHDLRTPVASMRMLAESLALGRVGDPAKQRVFLETIVRESDRLIRLTERVLYFFRFGDDSIVLNRRPVDLAALAGEAIEAIGPGTLEPAGSGDGRAVRKWAWRMGARLVTVSLKVECSACQVNVDADSLRQVMLNLLDNAVKYGGHGDAGAEIDVLVTSERKGCGLLSRGGKGVSVYFRDYGSGIADRDRRRLFKKYCRGSNARSANVSGVGIGLALSRHIVVAHGGCLDLVAHEGPGCLFRIFLPS